MNNIKFWRKIYKAIELEDKTDFRSLDSRSVEPNNLPHLGSFIAIVCQICSKLQRFLLTQMPVYDLGRRPASLHICDEHVAFYLLSYFLNDKMGKELL